MIEQVKKMVRISLLQKKREAAVAVVVVVVDTLVITTVSVQDEMARMQTELHALMQAIKLVTL